MNPRPPRCERGALPAELLPHPRAVMHSRRSHLALSIRGQRTAGHSCQGDIAGSDPGGRFGVSPTAGKSVPRAIKFFSALPIKVPGPSRLPEDARSSPGGGGKGSAADGTARNGHFSGIANRSPVIRGARMNIKKVYGNRYFPVDTANANF